MFYFSVPDAAGPDGFATFGIRTKGLLFAGSRNREVEPEVCRLLVERFGTLGFSFLTGCASGVDKSFRRALSRSTYTEQSLVACAFPDRVDRAYGLTALHVVPEGLPPRVALARRTLWMTERCSLLVLFPAEPMGRGSSLAFRSAIMQSKPVFTVQESPPRESDLYTIYPSSLYGIVSGYWCVPPVYAASGLCTEPV
jgi:hypothetical protein